MWDLIVSVPDHFYFVESSLTNRSSMNNFAVDPPFKFYTSCPFLLCGCGRETGVRINSCYNYCYRFGINRRVCLWIGFA